MTENAIAAILGAIIIIIVALLGFTALNWKEQWSQECVERFGPGWEYRDPGRGPRICVNEAGEVKSP